MNNRLTRRNKGFTLIELLIGMALMSIIMLMLVQFMSTTSASYRKTKKNLAIQTDAQQTMEQISDMLEQANYVRVSLGTDNRVYTLKTQTADSSGNKVKTADMYTATVFTPPADGSQDYLKNIKYDFVPDNYGNYVNSTTTERKVVVDFNTYEIVSADDGTTYPITGDYEFDKKTAEGVRSFRTLKLGDTNYYVKPKYIYAEYTRKNSSTEMTSHVIYCIENGKIYQYRYDSDDKTQGYYYAKTKVDALASATSGYEGLLCETIEDFYLSADTEGNSFLLDVMFRDSNYSYHVSQAINFRNTNVLTVRPQKLYEKVQTP